MEITKREIIASIVIIAAMVIAGFAISDKITDYQNDRNAEYQKAAHIEDSDLFRYGMETNIGNAFVYGDIEPVDTVTFDEIEGEYLYIEKIEERYERHEKWVTEEDSDGNEHREKKVWYDWETEGVEERHAEKIKFCGIDFPYGKISLPDAKYIDTIESDKVWSRESDEFVELRYQYYGVLTKHTGTIYTELAGGTISDSSRFYEDCTVAEVLERCTVDNGNAWFWICWILLTVGCVAGFYCLNNRWLED